MSTLEERLRTYAGTLDQTIAAREAELPARIDAPVALIPGDVTPRGSGTRRVLAVGVVVAVVAAATAVAIQRDHPTATAPPTPATVPTTTAAPISPGAQGLRTLFTRTTPSGIAITARIGRVSIADSGECPAPPASLTMRPGFSCGRAPGVEFAIAVAHHRFRVALLDRDLPRATGANIAPMIIVGQVYEVLPDGSTTYWPGTSPYLVVMYAAGVVKVRFHPDRGAAGGDDEMAPVSGWVAFVAPDSSIFKNKVTGLDAAGRVVATALPWRCC